MHSSSPPQDERPPAPVAAPPPSPAPPPRALTCAVLFHDESRNHAFIRNSDTHGIVERPQRITAIKRGVAAAWSRMEARAGSALPKWVLPLSAVTQDTKGDDTGLEMMMEGLGIGEDPSKVKDTKGKGKEVVGGPFDILFTSARLSVDDPALLFIHPNPNRPPTPDVDSRPGEKLAAPPPDPLIVSPEPWPALGPPSTPNYTQPYKSLPDVSNSPWPTQLQELCRNSATAIATPPSFSEIPAHLPQGDLYLSPGSEGAIFGALGAVCEGVDRVVTGARTGTGHDRAFVAVRPPGHHCCESAPMGFCFLNTVCVALAHAHQRHGVDRVIIIDFDLHHGNGTQEIVWRINAAAEAASLKRATSSPRKNSPSKTRPVPRQLSVLYASLHDVFSYPCEDGDPAMVQAASLNLSGGHSQYISNVHLEPWAHESEFHERLYPRYRDGLLGAATDFCQKTAVNDDESDRTLLILSAGFDASEHESSGMSRHCRNVPTSFFHRFTRDAVKFAAAHCGGKVLAVLEGGYSDRALASGALATLVGLAETPRFLERTFLQEDGDEAQWWDEKALFKLEKACGKPSGARRLPVEPPEPWLGRAVEIFQRIEGVDVETRPTAKDREKEKDVKPLMQLRERRPRGPTSNDSTPAASPARARVVSSARPGAPTPSKHTRPPTPSHQSPPLVPPSLSISASLPGTPAVPLLPAPVPTVDQPSPPSDSPSPSAYVTASSEGGSPDPEDVQLRMAAPGPTVRFTWKEGGI